MPSSADEPGSDGAAGSGPAEGPIRRRRSAENTRRLLIGAARRRFARDGYASTTVRDITEDAGVNVALVNRYFTSKEGLFEACLVTAVAEVAHAADHDVTLDEVARTIAGQLAGQGGGGQPDHLVILLRSSGDPRAEQVRREVLRSFAGRLAAISGRRSERPDGEQLLLRAQLTVAAALGVALMRATATMEPLASADRPALAAPLQDLVNALLGPESAGPSRPRPADRPPG